MATTPEFIGTPRIGRASLSGVNTATDGTGVITDIIAGAASPGTRILEVVIQATAQSAAGLVNLFIFDGTNYDLFDQLTVAAVTGSTTVRATRVSVLYQNLILPTASYRLSATLTVAPVSGTIRVTALGGNL